MHLLDKELPMRTETPGSVLDKLSILSLKIVHMREQTERADVENNHIQMCLKKLNTLLEQERDLNKSFQQMFKELSEGLIKMKIYRQHKMYNDPKMNPQLYKKKECI